ncbi:MAG: hypothetical protein U5R30_20935 [Deltaproteobacteria bacterium]|nr:hypothetical protein [Deltaproteobacteria bacterium]
MKFVTKLAQAAIISGLLVTSLAAQVFAAPTLVSAMADLDQIIIPVAVYSNQGKAEETKTAVSRLQAQWALFSPAAREAFPGDTEWTMGLDKVDDSIAEVSRASERADWPQVHEILESVRNTFEELRETRNIEYYLDGFSRYRRVLEKTTDNLTGKKASDLSDADINFVASMVPTLKSTWVSVQAAHLDAALFHFDSEKMAEIRLSMDAVRKNIEKLESAAAGGTRDQVIEALNSLKPSLKKTFLMFGRF